MRLKDKVAIVTGAGSGIGASIACAFVREGAKVVLADISGEGMEATAEEIEKIGGQWLAVLTDVSKADQVENMTRKTVEKFGKLDILVNNAGTPPPLGLGVADITEEDWDRVMSVDLKGPFLCCRYAVPEMINNGKGKIVNISSGAGLVAEKGVNAYGVAKGGLVLFTRQLAIDYGSEGIYANCICPGYINTPLIAPIVMDDKLRESIESFFPLRRIGKPEEVASAVVFLASDESDYITGAVLTVDGGALCGVAEMFLDWQLGVQEVIKKYGEF